jgi:hypothetical protein
MSFRCSRDCDGPGCPACARIAKLEAQLAAAVAADGAAFDRDHLLRRDAGKLHGRVARLARVAHGDRNVNWRRTIHRKAQRVGGR